MPADGPLRGERWPRIVAVLLIGLFIVGQVVDVVLGSALTGEFEQASLGEDVGLILAFGAFVLTGALLVARRPRNPLSWIIATVGALPSLFAPLDTYGAWVVTVGRSPDALVVFGFWGQDWYWFLLLALVMVFVPLHFPDGRLPSPRWRPWAAVPILSTTGLVVAGMTQPMVGSHFLEGVEVDNPIGIAWMPGPEEELAFLFLGLLFGLGVAVAAIIVRFRRSRGVQRQQLKVLLFAVGFLPLLPLGDYVPILDGGFVFAVIIAALPVAVAVAVLRYRLYGIDRVISRTLSYALLTAILVGVYAAGVLGVGAMLPGEPSDVLVAGSTLAAAALFRPLRSRIQGLVDRRFNRARYDALRTVEELGRRLRDRVDLDEVAAELRVSAAGALQPRSVSLWFAPAASMP